MTEEEALLLLNKHFPAYGWTRIGPAAGSNIRLKSSRFCDGPYFVLSFHLGVRHIYLYIRGAEDKAPYAKEVEGASELIKEIKLGLIYIARKTVIKDRGMTTELLKRSGLEHD